MEAVDVNVLLYAHREDAVDHDRYREWLQAWLGQPGPVGIADRVLVSAVRILTHPRVFDPPDTLDQAFAFARRLADLPNRAALRPGPRHLALVERLARDASARGALLGDAELAALAVEHGCTWVTTDRDFRRFPRLRSRHPFDDA